MLAYLLHPQYKYDDTKLSREQEEIARNYVVKLSPNFLPLVIAFQAKAEIISEIIFYRNS